MVNQIFYTEVSRGRSSEEVSVMEMERRAEFSELWSETGSRSSQKKKKKLDRKRLKSSDAPDGRMFDT